MHRPVPTFGPANWVTTVRAVGALAVAASIAVPPTRQVAAIAVAIGVVVTLLDGVDGWLARRTGMASAFGARFDMEVDALLILALAALAWRHHKAGAWVVLSGLLRYGFVGAGWVWDWMNGPLPPTFRAKLVCVLQIGALLLVLLPAVVPPASTTIAAVGLAGLSYSFLVDTRRLWRRAG